MLHISAKDYEIKHLTAIKTKSIKFLKGKWQEKTTTKNYHCKLSEWNTSCLNKMKWMLFLINWLLRLHHLEIYRMDMSVFSDYFVVSIKTKYDKFLKMKTPQTLYFIYTFVRSLIRLWKIKEALATLFSKIVERLIVCRTIWISRTIWKVLSGESRFSTDTVFRYKVKKIYKILTSWNWQAFGGHSTFLFSFYEHFNRQFTSAGFYIFKPVKCVWGKRFYTNNLLFLCPAWYSFSSEIILNAIT